MYKADYTVAHKVKGSPTGPGKVSLSPAAADAYYAINSSVTLTATPNPNHFFACWTNLLTGTPNQTTLSITKPYDVQAIFAPGGITMERGVIYPTAEGGSFDVGFRADSHCVWGVRSTATWAQVGSAMAGSGSGVLSITVDPNPTASYRVALVYVGNRAVVISQAPLR
jgi:hypothetical protein